MVTSPSVTLATSVGYDKGDNELNEACGQICCIYLMPEETPGKNSSRRLPDKDCATSHLLKWGFLPPNDVGREKEGKDRICFS